MPNHQGELGPSYPCDTEIVRPFSAPTENIRSDIN